MKLHHRLIALLLVLMLLVCAGCSARDDVSDVSAEDNVVYITTAAKTTAAATKATTTTTAATTTTTQAAAGELDAAEVEKARALLTEVYESRVFDDSLDLAQNRGLLYQLDFTGPFLRICYESSGSRYLPDVLLPEGMDPAIPEGVEFVPAQPEDVPEELVELLMTPEKDELLAEGKGMFALLEYTGYKKIGTYGNSFKLYCHRSRVSFYDLETGEMRGWLDSTDYRSAPYMLSSTMYASDGQHDVLKYDRTIWNEPSLWEKALNELLYDENGNQVVGTRLLSVPEDADPIVVPEGVTRIEAHVGEGHAAHELILPDGLEYIGENAFRDSYLEIISFPDSIRYVDDGAFRDSFWMKHTDVDGYVIIGDGILLYADPEGDEITLPAEVRYVMPGALSDLSCTKLTIPETVVQLCGQDYSNPVVSNNDTLETLVLRGGLQAELDVPEVYVKVASWCKNLKTVVVDCDTGELPYNWVQSFGDDDSRLTVYCKEDSPAEAWAKEKGIRVLPLSEYDGD